MLGTNFAYKKGMMIPYEETFKLDNKNIWLSDVDDDMDFNNGDDSTLANNTLSEFINLTSTESYLGRVDKDMLPTPPAPVD